MIAFYFYNSDTQIYNKVIELSKAEQRSLFLLFWRIVSVLLLLAYTLLVMMLLLLAEQQIAELLSQKEWNTPVNSHLQRIRNGQQKRAWTKTSDSPSQSKKERAKNQSETNFSLRILDFISECGFFTKSQKSYTNLRIRLKVITLTTTPVIKTKRRDGSQLASSSKKPNIFVLWLIPATISPKPKTMPIKKSISLAITDFSFSVIINKTIPIRHSPKNPQAGIDKLSMAGCLSQGSYGMFSWREQVAVTIPVIRNVITAANDLTENLGRPQSPCPLVHPLARSVPSPTRKPATTNCETEDSLTYAGLSKGRCILDFNQLDLCEMKLTRAEEKIIPSTTIALSLVACPSQADKYDWGI